MIIIIGGNHITSFFTTATADALYFAQYHCTTESLKVRNEVEHGFLCEINIAPTPLTPSS